jgi:hypothetical protein
MIVSLLVGIVVESLRYSFKWGNEFVEGNVVIISMNQFGVKYLESGEWRLLVFISMSDIWRYRGFSAREISETGYGDRGLAE